MKSILKPLLISKEGFTLLEVAGAVTILGIALVTLIGAQNQGIRLRGYAQKLTTATLLAQSGLAELERTVEEEGIPDVDDSDEGSFDEPFEDYRWKWEALEVELPEREMFEGDTELGGYTGEEVTAETSDVVMDAIEQAIREIRFTVYWGESEQERSLTVTTHFIDLKF